MPAIVPAPVPAAVPAAGSLPTAVAALLALADQRLPSGGHVHSGGIEQAVTEGWVVDAATLHEYLYRRLVTAGRVAAGLAAAATALRRGEVPALDAEADARTPSPAQREASRSQGRGLLRTARAGWAAPHPDLPWTALGPRPHHPIALGCAARAAGAGPTGAALVAAYLSVTGPATAGQRLLGLDPISVAATTLSLNPDIEAVAASASAAALAADDVDAAADRRHPPSGWADLPDDGDPWLDLLAERHAARSDALFAS